MSLLDGRIDCDVTEQIETGDEYYDALNQLNCPFIRLKFAAIDPIAGLILTVPALP